jgi:hypothetical protein
MLKMIPRSGGGVDVWLRGPVIRQGILATQLAYRGHLTTERQFGQGRGRPTEVNESASCVDLTGPTMQLRLQGLSGKRVRAQGDLQGAILWGAHVTPLE